MLCYWTAGLCKWRHHDPLKHRGTFHPLTTCHIQKDCCLHWASIPGRDGRSFCFENIQTGIRSHPVPLVQDVPAVLPILGEWPEHFHVLLKLRMSGAVPLHHHTLYPVTPSEAAVTSNTLDSLRRYQWCCWRQLCCGMCCCIIWLVHIFIKDIVPSYWGSNSPRRMAVQEVHVIVTGVAYGFKGVE